MTQQLRTKKPQIRHNHSALLWKDQGSLHGSKEDGGTQRHGGNGQSDIGSKVRQWKHRCDCKAAKFGPNSETLVLSLGQALAVEAFISVGLNRGRALCIARTFCNCIAHEFA